MQLRTLGSLVLEGTGIRRPKPLLLLAFLALEGSKSRRYLADLFYHDTRDPRDGLSSAIQRLKRVARGVVLAESHRVSTEVSCDAKTVLEASEKGNLREVVEGYRGPFLDGLDLSLGPELEEWLFGTREILADRVRQALLGLAETEAIRGRFEEAAAHADRAFFVAGAAELDPEDLKTTFALLVAGKSPSAAAVRDRAEEYGIELALTEEEARKRFRAASADAAGPPHNLPLAKTSFVGRDLDLIEVSRLLTDPQCRLLTLHGPGGIGKSRLAIQTTREQLYEGSFRDGIYLVQLNSLTEAEQIPASIEEALAIDAQDNGDDLARIKEFLKDREILLLLDNYEHLLGNDEHLAGAADYASRLLADSPGLKILTTSRERLNLEEEWVFEVEGLPVPKRALRHQPDVWHHGALQLFQERARRARLDFSPSEENLPHVLEICRLVEGSPLAIELAAAWVKILPTAEIAEEIRNNLAILATPARNVPERQRSIEATFEYSWSLLEPRDQEALKRLSVFVGGFRRQHAAEVVGATLPVLASLEDKSLLRSGRDGRYDRHPLIYHFARGKLAQDPEEERQALARHSALFLGFVKDRARSRGVSGNTEAFTGLSQELDNIRVAWESARDQDLLDFFWAFHPYQERRGMWKEALAWAERALEVAEAGDRVEDVGKVLHTIGMLHRRFWNLERAIEYLTKSLEIEEGCGDQADIARTHVEIGWAHYRLYWEHYRLHQLEQANEHFRAAKIIADSLEGPSLRADVHHGLGLVALSLGELEEALENLSTSRELSREQVTNPEQLARITADFARYYLDIDDKGRCLELFEEAETIFEELDNLSDRATNHFEFGKALLAFDDYGSAREYFLKAITLFEELGHQKMHYFSKLGLAEALLGLTKDRRIDGSAERARALAEEVYAYAETMKGGSLLGWSSRVLGEAWIALN